MSATGSVKSMCAEELFLLLKSSDFVTYDLHHAYDLCADRDTILERYYKPAEPAEQDEQDEPPQQKRPNWPLSLALRTWYRLVPGMEFRCFVGARVLLGISQRDFLNYYPFLESMREQIVECISQWFETVVEPTFPEDDCTCAPSSCWCWCLAYDDGVAHYRCTCTCGRRVRRVH